ncbi:MAG: hypothetical protein HXY20_08240 [Acidobacteria bacterium]|nr:hypothetical protein [Acidobacteriota bacterium]
MERIVILGLKRNNGSVPEESIRILETVGSWMDRNNRAIYGAEKCQVRRSNYANFTRKGNILYVHAHFWPGSTLTVAGLTTPVKSARLLASGARVNVFQDRFRVRFTGLPETAPDSPVTVIAAECASEPKQDTDFVRKERKRI